MERSSGHSGSDGRQNVRSGSARALTGPQANLLISTVLLGLSFLSHIGFLLMVEPLRFLNIPKEDAMIYSGAPLCLGVLFLVSAIYNFSKIAPRKAWHVLLIMFAAVFGSLTLQGLAGIGMHLARFSHE